MEDHSKHSDIGAQMQLLRQANIELDQRMHQHHIQLSSLGFDKRSSPLFLHQIKVTSFAQEGSIVAYQVLMAYFKMHLIMCNIQGRAFYRQINIGKGAFGQVRTEHYQGRAFIVKRQPFKLTKPEFEGQQQANRQEIQIALAQVAIAKICSLYKIGPQADLQIGFDLLCYADCTEFHMELCEPASDQLILNSRAILQESLRVMHSLHIVHKDIKPSNIVFSRTFGKCVFIDFGLSQIVKEQINKKSLAYWEGTPGFMSPEFMKLRNSQEPGYVNLYQNDIYALNKSFEVCQENIRSSKYQVPRNFNIVNKASQLQEQQHLADLINRQSRPRQGTNLLQLDLSPIHKAFELSNYEFLKLMYKYSSLEVFKEKSTRSCWRYLNPEEIKQIFDIIISRRNRWIIENAIFQIQSEIGMIDQQLSKQFLKFKRNTHRIRGPELQFSLKQPQLSIKNQIRIYGLSALLLQICKNTKTIIPKQKVVSIINEKQFQKQAKKAVTLKKCCFGAIESDNPIFHNKRLSKQNLTFQSSFKTDLFSTQSPIHINNNGNLQLNFAGTLNQFQELYAASVLQALDDWKRQISSTEFDQYSSKFKKLIETIYNLTDQMISKKVFDLVENIAEDINSVSPEAVIKYFKTFEKNFSQLKTHYGIIAFQINLSYYFLGQYSAIKLSNFFSPSHSEKDSIFKSLYFLSQDYYRSPHRLYWFGFFLAQLRGYLFFQRYREALQTSRFLLSLCEGRINTIFCQPKTTITFCLANFALIYQLFGLRNYSKIVMLKIEEMQLCKQEQTNSSMLILAFTSQNHSFRLLQKSNTIQNIIQQIKVFIFGYQIQNFISMSISQLGFMGSITSLSRQFNLTALIDRKEYENARKMVVWMISIKKQRPLSADYIVLEGHLFKILMSSHQYKRAFKVSHKMIAKIKEIPNCDVAFAEFFTNCAELCYFHSLPKKVIEYCEISRSLIKSPQQLAKIQLLLGKVQVLKGNYIKAKEILEDCLIGAVNLKIIPKQVHYSLSLIYILKGGIAQAEKNLPFLQQDPTDKSDQYRHHLRKSQLYLAIGTNKHLKSSQKNALSAKSVIHSETLIQPIKLQLHIGSINLSLKKYRTALQYFKSAAKLSIEIKSFYSPYTAYAFSKIGQTLSSLKLLFQGAIYCRITCGIFRKLQLKPNQDAVYGKSLTIARSHPNLPFVPFEVPLKRYFASIVPFMNTLAIEQHRQLYSVKCELLQILDCSGKCDVQRVKCRLEMAIHLKLTGQIESMRDLGQDTLCFLSKSTDKRIQKHIVQFKNLLEMIE